ncbi:hypothetical protein MmiHf6_00170 [Methanimicrococcus hongohii]|uniref:Uncharacterized protein n=1 Tax=Methanimicrococcus hongohii TaxID=3028295 RepID=A0AA96ZTK4_9EURY|nr:hypothetical protein [Methanimicrococcus sp. Hf6]WNY22732.1 hypothetical protein MmiHf6_00170 [Methanimicrococcus sp. Hf6]
MEAKKSTTESILWVTAKILAHVGYFIALFIFGLLIAFAITYVITSVNPGMEIATIQLTTIMVFSAICLIDIGLVFSNKISPGILLIVLFILSILVICVGIAAIIKQATKSEFVDILKYKLSPYSGQRDPEENMINVLATDIYNHGKYKGSF